jgi:ribosomal 30S subunit maturation factor RimM
MIDCDVYQSNQCIGKIKSILNGGYADILEIITAEGKTVMIPFEIHFIASVDMKARRIQIEEDFQLD